MGKCICYLRRQMNAILQVQLFSFLFFAKLTYCITWLKGQNKSDYNINLVTSCMRYCCVCARGTLSFLANDVTLVTSYGYCQSLKINDIRETSVLRFVRLGGFSVRRWVGVCTRRLKLLPTSVTANLKFAVSFLSACYKTWTHLKLNRKLRCLLLAIRKTEKLEWNYY